MRDFSAFCREVARSHGLSRRGFLQAAAICGGWSLFAPPQAHGIVRRRAPLEDPLFQLGVASGDPAPDGFVIWTRLAPEPLTGGGMPEENFLVDWQVAHDEAMTRIVQRGQATAVPESAHSLHVEVEALEPDRWYFYQFRLGNQTSRVGRARTAPRPETQPDRLRFAFASCQHYEQGLYTAYEQMANDDLDLVVHLGDYIYEHAPRPVAVRPHLGPELQTLADYRNRHAQYKTDAALQAMHALVPWIVTWDDHEVANNWAADIPAKPNVEPAAFLLQRAAAFQAYYEHMPLRRASLPRGPHMQLYRKLDYGQLARFNVLDTRQYRTNQPCGDGLKVPCEEVYSPAATMLGDIQERWLMDNLTDSPATWNILAQQVMVAAVDRMPGRNVLLAMDEWPGYEVSRRRLLESLAERQVSNPVVLTGDIHSNWVNDLHRIRDNQLAEVVATEFVGTSISSGGDGRQGKVEMAALRAENPFVKFYNGQRGYVRCEVSRSHWQSDYQVLSYVSRPGAPKQIAASFVVESGRPGAQKAS